MKKKRIEKDNKKTAYPSNVTKFFQLRWRKIIMAWKLFQCLNFQQCYDDHRIRPSLWLITKSSSTILLSPRNLFWKFSMASKQSIGNFLCYIQTESIEIGINRNARYSYAKVYIDGTSMASVPSHAYIQNVTKRNDASDLLAPYFRWSPFLSGLFRFASASNYHRFMFGKI